MPFRPLKAGEPDLGDVRARGRAQPAEGASAGATDDLRSDCAGRSRGGGKETDSRHIQQIKSKVWVSDGRRGYVKGQLQGHPTWFTCELNGQWHLH